MLFEESKDLEARLRKDVVTWGAQIFQLWIQISSKIENIFKSRSVFRVVVKSQVCRPLLVHDRRQKTGWRRRIVNKEDLAEEELKLRQRPGWAPVLGPCLSRISSPKILHVYNLNDSHCRRIEGAGLSTRLGASPPSCSQSGIEGPKIGKSPKRVSLR